MNRTKEELDAQYEKDTAANQALVDLRKATAEAEAEAVDEEGDPVRADAGYRVTLPGQTEVVAGTPAHVQELNTFSNVTHYAPDVNVVVAPEAPVGAAGAPTVVDVPYVSQDGDTLTCTMGNWTGEPTAYNYEWLFDGVGTDVNGNTHLIASDEIGKTATCVVRATNASGTTEAPPSNEVVVT